MILKSEDSGDIDIMVLPPGAGGEVLPLDTPCGASPQGSLRCKGVLMGLQCGVQGMRGLVHNTKWFFSASATRDSVQLQGKSRLSFGTRH